MNISPIYILAGIAIVSVFCFAIVSLVTFLYIKYFDKKNETEWSRTSAFATLGVIAWILSTCVAIWLGSSHGLLVFGVVALAIFFSAMYLVSAKLYKFSPSHHIILILLISVVLNPVWLSLAGII